MSDRQKVLIPIERACCVCAAVAAYGKRTESGYRMLSISGLIYRKGDGKGRVRITRKVNVCEPCAVRAFAGSPLKGDGYVLACALQRSLTALYNKLRAEDKE